MSAWKNSVKFPNSSHTVNTAILLAFLAMWLYTEVTEDAARTEFQLDLLERIERLEQLELEHRK